MNSKKTILPLILLAVVGIFGVTIYKYIQETKPPVLPDIDNNRAASPEVQKEKEAHEKLPHITLTEARGQLYTLFVDIRSIDAYRDHHITGSVHITEFVPEEYERTKHLVLVHGGGEQPSQKLQSLTNKMPSQFKTRILRGGFPVWTAEQLPTIERADIDDTADLAKIRFVEPRDLDPLLNTADDSIFLLDIRGTETFARGHIRGAHNIPLIEIEKRKREIPRRSTVYIYGREAIESFEGGALLFDLGFIDTHTLNGGFSAWQRFGYSVEK